MDWPHSPVHRLKQGGTFMVTCGTYNKAHFFRGQERLTLLRDNLLTLASQYEWELQAWTIFSNHYHFVGISPDTGQSLSKFLGHVHTLTASAINRADNEPGRKVWFQYWDTLLTFDKSYYARLNYVHNNAVKHGLVPVAVNYPWCSAAWFEQSVDRAFYRRVTSLKTDQVNVRDDFEPAWEE